jgi:hypothetical protein
MPSPVRFNHGNRENLTSIWLGVYAAATPGCAACNNATTVMEDDSPQPDVSLCLLPEVGGRTRVVDKLLHGAPELTAEVCLSSMSYDLHQKLELYRASEVYEYVAVLMREQEIRWHRLVAGQYVLMPSGADGIWRSAQFPGLWLNGAALLAGDAARVLATLQEGINSADHTAFVAELGRKRTQNNGG